MKMSTPLILAFILLMFFMGLAYYVGLIGDIGAVSGAINSGANVFSGRNTAGQLAGYATPPK